MIDYIPRWFTHTQTVTHPRIVTQQCMAVSQTPDLLITSPTSPPVLHYQTTCSSSNTVVKKDKVDHAPVWSVGGVLISLSVAVSP